MKEDWIYLQYIREHLKQITKKEKPKKLLPSDFYMEDGRIVFTADYLRHRGYCCNNNCRHCPFKA